MSKEDKIVYELIKKVYKVLLTKSIIYIFIADWFFFHSDNRLHSLSSHYISKLFKQSI